VANPRTRALGAALLVGDRRAAMKVRELLERTGGRVRLAARWSGIAERTLHRWLRLPILADAPRQGRARKAMPVEGITRTVVARALGIQTREVARLAAATGATAARQTIRGRTTLVFTDHDVARILMMFHARRGARLSKRWGSDSRSHAD
jgi:hypothetical protein